MAEKAVTKAKGGDAAKTPQSLAQSEKPVSPWERDLERFFDDFSRLGWPRRWHPERRWFQRGEFIQPPVVDVIDEKDRVVVKAELPGLSKDDIEVELRDSALTIKGEKKREKEIKDAHYYRSEREYGSVYRSIELPAAVKTEDVKATFADGVLEVRLPKTEDAKRKSVKVAVR